MRENWLWLLFEIAVNFYQGFLVTWFIDRVLSKKRSAAWASALCCTTFALFCSAYLFFDMPAVDTWLFLIPLLYALLCFRDPFGTKLLWWALLTAVFNGVTMLWGSLCSRALGSWSDCMQLGAPSRLIFVLSANVLLTVSLYILTRLRRTTRISVWPLIVFALINLLVEGVLDVLFIFGVAGMVMGSVSAVRAKTTRIMVAYSSVAQIGYIFAALGLRSQIGIICALWHMAAHAATKSMLFLSTAEMDDACGGTHLRRDLRGAFYRAPLLALAFSLGALNLTGVPLLSVFMTKVTLTQAAIDVGGRHMGIILAAVAISTMLNAAYFLGTAVELFIPTKEGDVVLPPTVKKNKYTAVSMVCLIVMNLLLGIFSQPILSVLAEGLTRFA